MHDHSAAPTKATVDVEDQIRDRVVVCDQMILGREPDRAKRCGRPQPLEVVRISTAELNVGLETHHSVALDRSEETVGVGAYRVEPTQDQRAAHISDRDRMNATSGAEAGTTYVHRPRTVVESATRGEGPERVSRTGVGE